MKKMETMPLQMVIIELENGQRSVFIGRPLCLNDYEEEECQVESVWFTDVRLVPCCADLDQLTALAISQIEQQVHKLQ